MTVDAVALMDDSKEQCLPRKKGNEIDASKAALWGHKEINLFMGPIPDGLLDTLHSHFRCTGFLHLEPFPAEHNKARRKYEEKRRISLKLCSFQIVKSGRILMTTSSMTRLLFVGRNFYMVHYISLS